MERYTLRYIGFDRHQQDSISAILDLADAALTDTWILTIEDSDIVLFNINQEGGLAKLKTQKNIPDNRVVYVGVNDSVEPEAYWFLKKSESGPPSLRALVMLLNNISVFLAEKQEHNDNEATEFRNNLDTSTIKIETIPEPKKDLGFELKVLTEVGVIPEIEVGSLSEVTSIPELGADNTSKVTNYTEVKAGNALNDVSVSLLEDPSLQALQALASAEMIVLPLRKLSPKNYFFGLIQQVLTDKSCCAIKLYNLPVMYLCGKTGRYACAGSRKQILQFCIAMPQHWTKNNLTVARFEKQVFNQPELHLYALNDLYILSILFVGQGRLLDGQTAEQTILLKTFVFMDSPLLGEYTPLIEAMKEANTLIGIAEQLQTPLSKVIDIYNVVYLLGTIDILDQPSTTVARQQNQPVEASNKKNLGQLFISLFKK